MSDENANEAEKTLANNSENVPPLLQDEENTNDDKSQSKLKIDFLI